MNILVGKRGQGKTTHLIRMSAAGEGRIVAFSEQNAKYIKTMAKDMEMDIPDPVGWGEFIRSGRGRNEQYLVDELGAILMGLGVKTATIDSECTIEDLPTEKDSAMVWATKEVELAIASEKAASEDSDEEKYGVMCYEIAMKAYQTLRRYKLNDFNTQVVKSILNRLIDGKCLTPIEDTPDIWSDVTGEFSDWKDGAQHYQSNRMSSLFKQISPDGEVTYSDINRVQCIDIGAPNLPYTNGFATRLIDKIFPISMPYLPANKKFRLFTEKFLVDPKNGDYDTIAYLYILMPDGKTIELNRYFKEENGQMVKIESAEFDERKAKRVDKK